MSGRNNAIFTGRGFTTTGSTVRVSYQWFGFSDMGPLTPGDWTTIPYVGLINGRMNLNSSATVSVYGTTAFNGFVDGTVGSTVMSGSVYGYAASSATQPVPVAPYQSQQSKLFYIKIVSGGTAIESRALISGINLESSVDEAVRISFDFTMIGIPRQATYAFITGASQP